MIMISVFYTCRKIACVSAQLMLFCSFVEPTQNKVYLILSYLILSYLILQGAEGVVQGSAPIYPAGPGEAHQDSEADCP